MNISDYEIGTFGVIVAVGVLLSLYVSRRLGRRDNLPPAHVNDVALGVLFFGFVGSKLLGVLVALIGGAPLTWAELRNAGAVHGGLIVGTATCVLMARHFKLRLPLLLDSYVPAVALGQAIGRLGCLAAGCCFGAACDLPWAISFSDPRAHALGGVPLHVLVHPVQLYDAGLHIALFLILGWLHRRNLLRERLFGLWCMCEGGIRIFVETFRGDLGRGVWFGLDFLSTGRVTAMSFFLLGLTIWLYQSRHSAPQQGHTAT